MPSILNYFSPLLALILLAGCATLPTGPSVMALPGTGKSFDQFRADDAECRQYAYVQVGGRTPSQAASESGARSAALGTALGATAGAVIGGGEGAGVGAGTGLLVGSLAGASAGESSAYTVQQRYDVAYIQCMYAKGERVPVPAGSLYEGSRQKAPQQSTYPPPPGAPPPPPGTPPPPPPGAPP